MARFELALERQAGTEAFLCLSQATVHRPPPLDARAFPVTEAGAGARYLIERGIEPERIRLEAFSLELSAMLRLRGCCTPTSPAGGDC